MAGYRNAEISPEKYDEMIIELTKFSGDVVDERDGLALKLQHSEEQNGRLQWRINQLELQLQHRGDIFVEFDKLRTECLALIQQTRTLEKQALVRDEQNHALSQKVADLSRSVTDLSNKTIHEAQMQIKSAHKMSIETFGQIQKYGAKIRALQFSPADSRAIQWVGVVWELVDRIERTACENIDQGNALQDYEDRYQKFVATQTKLHQAYAEFRMIYAKIEQQQQPNPSMSNQAWQAFQMQQHQFPSLQRQHQHEQLHGEQMHNTDMMPTVDMLEQMVTEYTQDPAPETANNPATLPRVAEDVNNSLGSTNSSVVSPGARDNIERGARADGEAHISPTVRSNTGIAGASVDGGTENSLSQAILQVIGDLDFSI